MIFHGEDLNPRPLWIRPWCPHKNHGNVFYFVLKIILGWCLLISSLQSKAAVRSKAVVLLLLTFCLLLLPLWESVIVLCFVVRYLMSILVLLS